MVRKAANAVDKARAERPTKTSSAGANTAFVKAALTKSSDSEIARLEDDLRGLEREITQEIDQDVKDLLVAQRDNKLKLIDFAKGGQWF